MYEHKNAIWVLSCRAAWIPYTGVRNCKEPFGALDLPISPMQSMHKVKRRGQTQSLKPLLHCFQGFAFCTVLPKCHDEMSLNFLQMTVDKVKWLIHPFDKHKKKTFISDAGI